LFCVLSGASYHPQTLFAHTRAPLVRSLYPSCIVFSLHLLHIELHRSTSCVRKKRCAIPTPCLRLLLCLYLAYTCLLYCLYLAPLPILSPLNVCSTSSVIPVSASEWSKKRQTKNLVFFVKVPVFKGPAKQEPLRTVFWG